MTWHTIAFNVLSALGARIINSGLSWPAELIDVLDFIADVCGSNYVCMCCVACVLCACAVCVLVPHSLTWSRAERSGGSA